MRGECGRPPAAVTGAVEEEGERVLEGVVASEDTAVSGERVGCCCGGCCGCGIEAAGGGS